MGADQNGSRLPEARRNALLRRVDWRFLLSGEEAPRVLNMAGVDAEALPLVSRPAGDTSGAADVVVLGYPSDRELRRARQALQPGGSVVCAWRLPRPGGSHGARRRLLAAGFRDAHVYWAGPVPHRLPQFWLPLDSSPARAHLLGTRPPRSALQRLLRPLWRAAARLGLLWPLYAVADAPGGPPSVGERGGIDHALPGDAAMLLLTGGRRSINKVVALAFRDGAREPEAVVKLARVPEAEEGLTREADVLERLEKDRPGLMGVPRLLARGRRSGAPAVAEGAIAGRPLLDLLTAGSFADLAERVTRFLVGLAGPPAPLPPAGWAERLVEDPLKQLERQFGAVLSPGVAAAARGVLFGLGPLPLVCEHRDCAPWNIVIATDGSPVMFDWESAEPSGLPGLDLVYFLTNAAFVLDGALESGRTRETYARLLDPATAHGSVAAACIEEYRRRLRIDAETFDRLRALCWVVHCRSDYRHLELDAAGPPGAAALRGSAFLGLLEEELSRAQA